MARGVGAEGAASRAHLLLLLQAYVRRGEGDAEEVATTMQEMRFFFDQTTYEVRAGLWRGGGGVRRCLRREQEGSSCATRALRALPWCVATAQDLAEECRRKDGFDKYEASEWAKGQALIEWAEGKMAALGRREAVLALPELPPSLRDQVARLIK